MDKTEEKEIEREVECKEIVLKFISDFEQLINLLMNPHANKIERFLDKEYFIKTNICK